MPALRALPLCALAFAAAAKAQQAPLILKAGTPVTIANQKEFIPQQARLGDTVDFSVTFPVREGKLAVIPKGTVLHGRVTALKPKVEIALEPVEVAGTTVAFAGHPFELKGAKHDDTPQNPSEFAWHGQFTTKEKFEIGGVILVAAPIVIAVGVVALPIYGIVQLTHQHGHKHAETRSLVTLAADTPLDAAALPGPKPYSGLPIVYLVDRYRTDHTELLCNGQPFFAKAFSRQLALRVPPQTYTFAPAEPDQTSAAVDAKPDGRYLVYRDKAGLHAEDLATRPELLEQGLLPGDDKSDKYFFDYTRIPANQQAALDDARRQGGCGITPQLHARPPRLEAPAP